MTSFFFFFNDTATTEIYTLSPTRRSSDLEGSGARGARCRSVEAAAVERLGCGVTDRCAARLCGVRRAASSCVARKARRDRSEEHTSELQSQSNLVCRLLLEKKNITGS